MLKEGLDPLAMQTNAALDRRNWHADGLAYLSPIDAWCTPAQGCLARLELPGPYNLTAVDYGHLSPEGSRSLAQTLLRAKIAELLRNATTSK
jgi:hypothetical protein